VALTRAKHWLIVCGAGPEPKPDSDAWYALVAEAMDRLATERVAEADRETLILGADWPKDVAPAPEPESPAPAKTPVAPLTPRLAKPRPFAPSALGGEHVLAGTGLADDPQARARGEAIHRLLEFLHGRDPAERAALAARLLPDAPDRDELLAEATALLDAAELAAVFAPESLAEVEVSAPLAELGGARMIGRIDRLIVAADEILAVDFKSHRAVPDTPAAVPEGILRQMGAYRAALASIWPDRPVATAILWTRTGVLMRLPADLVAAALSRAADLDPVGPRS
jgi:ATP-dependent helicase/nuclease subunit A